jgi:hypothetical protein
VFLLSRQLVWRKLVGIILPAVFIIPFILHTRNAAFKLTGSRQFSLFTGWQLANNALYIYDKIDVDSANLPTAESRELNRISIQYFRRVKPDIYRDYLESYVGNFFIRQPEAPLKVYYYTHYRAQNDTENIITWAKASSNFEPFGRTIILQNPLQYFRYFMVPNIKNYFMPPLSHLEVYNYGINEVDPIAKYWFHYKSEKLHCFSNTFQGTFLILYVALFLLFNVYYLFNLVRLFFKIGRKEKNNIIIKADIFITAFVLINFVFSISTTVNILRYQFVPLIILIAFSLQINDYLEEKSKTQKKFVASPETSALYRISKPQI